MNATFFGIIVVLKHLLLQMQHTGCFECRLPLTVLDIKGCLQFISLKKSFAQIYFTLTFLLP